MKNPITRLSRWWRPRSAGVRVSRRVYLAIRRGDRARARGDWRVAARHYRHAVALAPGLGHIWLQLGHAWKEAEALEEAYAAYRQAGGLLPRDPEPHLFMGHLAKRAGEPHAGDHYLAALRIEPDSLSAAQEVMGQLLADRTQSAHMIDEALVLLKIDRRAVAWKLPPLATGTVVFDISDLLGFLSFSRIPSGVQRVQIEITLALLDKADAPIALCQYAPARHAWVQIAKPSFRTLCAAIASDEAGAGQGWAQELRQLFVGAALAPSLAFSDAATLVSFAAGLPSPNYCLDARTQNVRRGVAFVPLMYDIIPSRFPQWFVPAQARDFQQWVEALLHSATGFLAISETTRSDMLAHAAAQGRVGDAMPGRVVRLDGDTHRRGLAALPFAHLDKWGLKPERYVLLVSTVEPRKNHIGAMQAWLRLARTIGADALPHLVCVGGKGWLNDDIHALHARHKLLRDKVMFLSGVADAELDLLYRGCAFTLYPSFYEGWGLPITESLSYGKVPAVSNTSSMPEAGGDLAVYFDPTDVEDIAAKLAPLMTRPEERAAREAQIAAAFAPRSWAAIGSQLIDDARAIAAAARAAPIDTAALPAGSTWSMAEAGAGLHYRIGTGWGVPNARGCAVVGDDAELRVSLARGAVIALTLAATANLRCAIVTGDERIEVTLAGGDSASIVLHAAHDAGWRTIALVTESRGALTVAGFDVPDPASRPPA